MVKKTWPVVLLGLAGLVGPAVVAPENSQLRADNITVQLSLTDLNGNTINSVRPGDQAYLKLSGSGFTPNSVQTFYAIIGYDPTKSNINLPSEGGLTFNNVSGGNISSPAYLGNIWQSPSNLDVGQSLNRITDLYADPPFGLPGIETTIVPISAEGPYLNNSNSGDIGRWKIDFPVDDPLGETSFLVAAIRVNGANTYFSPIIDPEFNNPNFTVQNLQMAIVPEPATYGLGLGLGALALTAAARRRRNKASEIAARWVNEHKSKSALENTLGGN